MFQSIARYTNEAPGIEKTLKFVQSFSQVAENLLVASSPKEAAQWATAKNQVNIARRYFRLFKWIDCWTLAYGQFVPATKQAKENPSKPAEGDTIRFILTASKWSLLGIYLFMEMFTIADAMLITNNAWAPTLQIEALKFWFYALAVSAVLGLYELFLLASAPTEAKTPTTEKKGQKGKKEPAVPGELSSDVRAEKRRVILKRVVADSCDLLIPGAIVGWIPLGPVPIGIAGSISAVLGGSEVWERVNA